MIFLFGQLESLFGDCLEIDRVGDANLSDSNEFKCLASGQWGPAHGARETRRRSASLISDAVIALSDSICSFSRSRPSSSDSPHLGPCEDPSNTLADKSRLDLAEQFYVRPISI